METIKRPSCKETDKDVLDLQRIFLDSRTAPSAQIVTTKKKDEQNSSENIKNKAASKTDIEMNDTQLEAFTGKIIEKDVQNAVPKIEWEDMQEERSNTSFPKVPTLTKAQLTDPDCKNQSLFAKYVLKKKSVNVESKKETRDIEKSFGDKSIILDGTGLDLDLIQKIHDTNADTLSNMKEEEIMREQEMLKQKLLSSDKGADLIRFLKEKKEKKLENVPRVNAEKSVKETKPENVPQVNDEKSVKQKKSHVEQKSAEDLSQIVDKIPQENVEKSMGNMESLDIAANEFDDEINEIKKYPYMGKVEVEKLQWMRSIPEMKSSSAPMPARFDFEGNLVSNDSSIPVHQGLHHHGDQPEVPGYTLNEAFQFIRSANIQQRVLGLRILSKVFLKAKNGEFDVCLESAPIPQCLDAGVVLLLRWSLDDSIQASIEAGLTALCHLIGNQSDELALSHVFWWEDGFYFPFLSVGTDKSENEEREMNDVDLVKFDVIKGLLRMDLLSRIRYVLDQYKLNSPAISAIIGILIRIARHSLQSASLIALDPHLLNLISKHFLPKSWSNLDSDCSVPAYNVPSSDAIYLFRVLASCGSNMASILEHKFKLMDFVLCYVSIDLSQLKTVTSNSCKLILECLCLWKCFIEYGIGIDQFVDMYPWIMNVVVRFQTLSWDDKNPDKTHFDFDFNSAVLGLVESVIRRISFCTVRKRLECSANWSHVIECVNPINVCLRKWFRILSQINRAPESILKFIGRAFSFLSTFYNHIKTQSKIPVISFFEQMEELLLECLLPFWKSGACTSILSRLELCSCFLDKRASGRSRDSSALPSIGSIKWKGNLSRVLKSNSPYYFLTGLTNYLISCHSLHRKLDKQLMIAVLSDKQMSDYLVKLTLLKNSTNREADWFGRFESRFVYNVLHLFLLTDNDLQETTVFYRVGCTLLQHLLIGDDSMIDFLLGKVLFNPDFLQKELELSQQMEKLCLSETPVLPLVTGQIVQWDHSQLEVSAVESLKLQWIDYSKAFDLCKNAKKSRTVTDSLESMGLAGGIKYLIDIPWVFLPFVNLYSQIQLDPRPIVTRCLQQVFLFCRANPNAIDVSAYFQFVATVFMFGNDFFFDPTINAYMLAILINLLNHPDWPVCRLKEYRLRKDNSFREFYLELLAQYDAVSFGDPLFSLFILIPIQQQFDVQYRIDLWTERSIILRSVRTSLQQIEKIVNKYLFPLEKNENLLTAYFIALLNGSVTKNSPLPYLIAIHHLHHYLFDDDDDSLTNTKIRIAQSIDRSAIKDMLLRYHKENPKTTLGFELHDEVPSRVQNKFEELLKIYIN